MPVALGNTPLDSVENAYLNNKEPLEDVEVNRSTRAAEIFFPLLAVVIIIFFSFKAWDFFIVGYPIRFTKELYLRLGFTFLGVGIIMFGVIYVYDKIKPHMLSREKSLYG